MVRYRENDAVLGHSAAGNSFINWGAREAAVASRRAVELDPESAKAHASRGLAESLSKNYEGAKKEFETSIRLNPRLFEAYYFYGRAWFAQGQYEKAAALFAKASHENPDDYEAHAMSYRSQYYQCRQRARGERYDRNRPRPNLLWGGARNDVQQTRPASEWRPSHARHYRAAERRSSVYGKPLETCGAWRICARRYQCDDAGFESWF